MKGILKKKLLYCSVSLNKDYIKLLRLLFESLKISNSDCSKFDVLVITQSDMQEEIKKMSQELDIEIITWCPDPVYSEYRNNKKCNNLKSEIDKTESAQVRLRLWEWENVNEYEAFLYLDVDVLVLNDINQILYMDGLENKLYAQREGTLGWEGGPVPISGDWTGSMFFDFSKIDKKTPSFCSGILLFKNCKEIKNLFKTTLNHIDSYIATASKKIPPSEQPFLIYNTISSGMCDNIRLNEKIIGSGVYKKTDISKVVFHFNGGYGYGDMKYITMSECLNRIKKEMG